MNRVAFSSIAAVAFILLTTSACSIKMPDSMTVKAGDEPDNIDEDVRFRTTYYFRVFDQCNATQPSDDAQGRANKNLFEPETDGGQIISDSLYRFRMTGKANALTNMIKFESGTLKEWQIDPLGANVGYDKTNGRFYPVSQQQTIADANEAKRQTSEKAAFEHVRELMDLRKEMLDSIEGEGADAKLDSDTKKAINKVITDAVGRISAKPNQSQGDKDAGADATPTTPTVCQDGNQPRRGFQILGPEGFRTFDPDERLILAMYSSGKPLISTMQNLSSHVLNQKSISDGERLLPFAEERIRVLKTERALTQFSATDSNNPAAVIDAALAAFAEEEGQ